MNISRWIHEITTHAYYPTDRHFQNGLVIFLNEEIRNDCEARRKQRIRMIKNYFLVHDLIKDHCIARHCQSVFVHL